MKLLIGGSPCTHWSVAKLAGRETEPEGLGWELFKNYLIAREKYAPEYFLYENNNSISAAIKKRITAELGVEPIMIDSALVSAQFRQRLYWTNIPGVEQPEDRGIMLRDILEKERKDWRPVGKWAERLFFGSRTRTKLEALKTVESEKAFTLTTRKLHPSNYICNPERTEYSNFTISEYEALQTVPKGYTAYVPEAQRYKMLGNGWTVDVIAHILSFCPGITEKPLEVLSMYDGMSCGRLALDKLGAWVAAYWATEIDKYAIKTTQANFPDTVQLGDAFQVREDGWKPWEGAKQWAYAKGAGGKLTGYARRRESRCRLTPEPVFVIEGGGKDLFFTDEGDTLKGRAARPDEVTTREAKLETPVGYVPHWKTCPNAADFRRR